MLARKFSHFVWVGLFGFIWMAGASVSDAQSQLPDGPGKDVVLKVCAGCHDPEVVAAQKLSRDEWGDKISHMVELGAKGSEAEFYQVLDYLSVHFSNAPPKVNVNKASAQDIETMLQLTGKEAAALVHYREQNGKFKTLDDVKKVPGLDAAKLDSAKDRVVFE